MHIYICTNACVSVCMHACICMHMCVCVCVHVSVCAYAQTDVCVCGKKIQHSLSYYDFIIILWLYILQTSLKIILPPAIGK